MDGYAVRACDVEEVPVTLNVVAEVPAGHSFNGPVPKGSCVRIFTGAPLPDGCDTLIIQENTKADEQAATVTVMESARAGTYIRPEGLDFHMGETLIDRGTRLGARHIGLAAAMNRPWLSVYRQPRIAILSTGDEIVLPGDPLQANQIVSSNGPALAAAIQVAGGIPTLLSIAKDDPETLKKIAQEAHGHDLLLTTGGASVGKHDLIGSALVDIGLDINFWKIAMRPGKPLLFGSMNGIPMLGLPGTPVSAMVCFLLFGQPAVRTLSGEAGSVHPEFSTAILTKSLPENDRREDYLRGILSRAENGKLHVTPFSAQDSSMMRRLSEADCLIRRPGYAGAVHSGQDVDIIEFLYSSTAF
jgi:molybdopterin molybdotransferase